MVALSSPSAAIAAAVAPSIVAPAGARASDAPKLCGNSKRFRNGLEALTSPQQFHHRRPVAGRGFL